jgi:hypothetical protein
MICEKCNRNSEEYPGWFLSLPGWLLYIFVTLSGFPLAGQSVSATGGAQG